MSTTLPIVCVVDDDPSVLRALGRLLRSLGLRPAAFASAAELLGDPRRRQASCFLLDVQMPAMNGFELARRLTAEAAGGCALLRKPFEDCDLAGVLRKAIGAAGRPETATS